MHCLIFSTIASRVPSGDTTSTYHISATCQSIIGKRIVGRDETRKLQVRRCQILDIWPSPWHRWFADSNEPHGRPNGMIPCTNEGERKRARVITLTKYIWRRTLCICPS